MEKLGSWIRNFSSPPPTVRTTPFTSAMIHYWSNHPLCEDREIQSFGRTKENTMQEEPDTQSSDEDEPGDNELPTELSGLVTEDDASIVPDHVDLELEQDD